MTLGQSVVELGVELCGMKFNRDERVFSVFQEDPFMYYATVGSKLCDGSKDSVKYISTISSKGTKTKESLLHASNRVQCFVR